MSDWRDPQRWFENLQDFYDWVSPIVGDYTEQIGEIERLLFSKRTNGKTLNDTEIKQNKDKAYKAMRDMFRKIQKELWDKDMYVPKYEKPDPRKAMLEMNI